jgi:hypothetical protein
MEGHMDPSSSLLLIAATSANQASKKLDDYALQHDLTRGEAVAELAVAAKVGGDKNARRLLDELEIEMSWRRGNPIAGIGPHAVDPLGIRGTTTRTARGWLRSKP